MASRATAKLVPGVRPNRRKGKAPKHTPHQTRDRRNRILELRLAGYSLRQIQELLAKEGIEWSHTGVARDVSIMTGSLDKAAAKQAPRLRALEDARLDRLLTALDEKIAKGDTLAIKTALTLSARRAKLWGLDQDSSNAKKVLQDAFAELLNKEPSHAPDDDDDEEAADEEGT